MTGEWFTASRSLPSGVYSVVRCTGCIGAAGAGRLDRIREEDTQTTIVVDSPLARELTATRVNVGAPESVLRLAAVLDSD